MFKTGVLCIPAYDEAAVDAVRQCLRRTLPDAVIMADRHVESRRYLIEERLRQWCDEDELDLVITIGGTLPAPGPGNQEITPEATAAVIERAMPGLPEAMRAYAVEAMPLALLDRSLAGIRGRTLILNLPAGAETTTLFLEAIVDVLAPILAHLREDTSAPTIAASLKAESVKENPQANQPIVAPSSEGDVALRLSKPLDADEFAAFLRRHAPEA